MQATAVMSDGMSGVSQVGGLGSVGGPVNQQNRVMFEQMLNETPSAGTVPSPISDAIRSVESRFNEKQLEIVKSMKNFEETGGAVALMMASHQGANNSVMVQLCGTVSKKCADNTEQIYKQQ